MAAGQPLVPMRDRRHFLRAYLLGFGSPQDSLPEARSRSIQISRNF